MHPVFAALAHHASARPNALAFQDDHNEISWEELASRVAGLARRLQEGAPQTVAIGLAGGIDYVVADLALTLSGRRQVPLPFFFSTEQTTHILQESQAAAVISTDPDLWQGTSLGVIAPDGGSDDRGVTLPAYSGGAERVIYTSGSSGRPKGVIIGDRQLDASLAALSGVIGAGAEDRHLSVLPLAQLLEQICGIFLPVLAGAECIMRFAATKALLGGPVEGLSDAMVEVQPTTSLLAPGILGRWVETLRGAQMRAPESLRFVAVGGAASSPGLIRRAEDVGIPVHEGYGLSECCAVVAMNRPGKNVPGTVGPVLDGLDVRVINGEITVAGPTVMEGYLNGDAAPERWRTGDMGHFDGDQLVVDGRKDALLITGEGRNISPEWVEARVNADPRILSSALGLRERDGALILIVVLAAQISTTAIADLLSDLPGYACPTGLILTDPSEPGLLFAAGTPNRVIAARIINTTPATELYDATQDKRRVS